LSLRKWNDGLTPDGAMADRIKGEDVKGQYESISGEENKDRTLRKENDYGDREERH
jgi:hypothetical protein